MFSTKKYLKLINRLFAYKCYEQDISCSVELSMKKFYNFEARQTDKSALIKLKIVISG